MCCCVHQGQTPVIQQDLLRNHANAIGTGELYTPRPYWLSHTGTTFTFSHLADAFIQSDLHMCDLQCIHILHLH